MLEANQLSLENDDDFMNFDELKSLLDAECYPGGNGSLTWGDH